MSSPTADRRPPSAVKAPRWATILGQSASDRRRFPSTAQLAEAVRLQADQVEPPVDLSAVIGRWPGLSVGLEDLDGTGYLLDLGMQGGEILLRSGDSLPRRRFTLAHELGHWLLATPEAPGDLLGHTSRTTERWCDQFAVDLLLPADWVSEYVESKKKSGGLAQELARLPRLFGVSRPATLLRISEVTDVTILVRDRNSSPNSWAGMYVSGRTSPSRTIVKLKRLIERLPARDAAALLRNQLEQSTGEDLSIETHLTAHGRELFIVAYPAGADSEKAQSTSTDVAATEDARDSP